MDKQKVFVTSKIPSSGIELLRKNGLEVEIWPLEEQISYEELKIKAVNYSGLVTMLSDKIDAELMNHCPELKVISNYAVGYNNIDIAEATKKGIAIGNTPDVLTDATADLAVTLLLAISRKLIPAKNNVENNLWKGWEPMGFLGKRLRGKTLGIFGMGRIGKAVAERLVHGFGMNLIYTARSEKDFGKKVSFMELLKNSDVISINSPLTNDTKGLFNYAALKSMKSDSILINTARGEIISEKDLVRVLEEDHLFGVGLDVTEKEPLPSGSLLRNFKNVLITPHIGSADEETRDEMSLLCANNILNALSGKNLPAFINPEAWSDQTK